MSTTDVLSENLSWREKQASRLRVVELLLRLCKLITFISDFVELQPAFTAEPPRPFTVVEGNNISLEWSYDLGFGGSIKRLEFEETTSSPSILIFEVSSVGQYPVDQTPDVLDDSYNGRLQANITEAQTSITIILVNRTVDSKDYQFRIVQVGGPPLSLVSEVKISVQCKYKSRPV